MDHPALATLRAQQAAWNAGDLDGYLARCADDVVYVNARGPVVGRRALRIAMTTAYPDRGAMGSLALEPLRVDGDDTEARVLLRWAVTPTGTAAGGATAPTTTGHALVILRSRDGQWWMTHDATV